MDRQFDERRVIDGFSPVGSNDGTGLQVFGEGEQLDPALVQRGEWRSARLQGVDRVAG